MLRRNKKLLPLPWTIMVSLQLENLKLQIDTLESSLKRPNQILVKYKELQNTLSRNENIYTSIESNLINLNNLSRKVSLTPDIKNGSIAIKSTNVQKLKI